MLFEQLHLLQFIIVFFDAKIRNIYLISNADLYYQKAFLGADIDIFGASWYKFFLPL